MDTGNPAMFNRYAYTENDPVNMLDPDGRQGTPFSIMRAHNNMQELRRTDPAAAAKAEKQAVGAIVAVGLLAVPGPEDVVIGVAAATKAGQAISGALKGAGAAKKIDVGSPPVSVGNTPNAARADLDAAGFPGSPTSQTSEVGTMHKNVPGADGPMDVRVMNGQAGASSGATNGPRMVTTRAGTNDGVRVDGSRFKNNESKSQRRAGCHTSLECN